MAINLSDDQKFQILKEAHIEQRKESSFWRERSWKVTTWLIGLMLAVSGVTMFSNAKYPIVLIPFFCLSIIATIYLHKNYKRYSQAWDRVLAIEDALGFSEENVYVQGKSLLPAKLRMKPTYKGTGSFIAAIWVMAISTALALLLK